MFSFSHKLSRRAIVSLSSVKCTRHIHHFSKLETSSMNSHTSKGSGIVPSILYRLTLNPSAGDPYSSIYQYTAGRWLWNEEKQPNSRYIRFNIDALCCIAAKAVGSVSCTSVTKLTEGNFNKVLLLTMCDGKEVIAKVPNPNAGHAGFITASEVATMDFVYALLSTLGKVQSYCQLSHVRNCLQIPAPRVIEWCSKSSETPVGAEFIIMEKVSGIKLSNVWEEMHVLKNTIRDRGTTQYGSLYYAENHCSSNNKFTVGPTTNRKYFDDRRQILDLDRGPWKSIDEYVIANAQREKESIERLRESPRLQGFFNGPGQYQSSKAAKIKALQCYFKVAKYLLPKNRATHRPVLWHPDLHADNIFVDPEDQQKITGVIDWQAAHIAPMFLQVRRPAILDFDGPIPESLKVPELPSNFDQLSVEEKRRAKKLQGDQAMYVLYEIDLLKQCKDAGYALRGRSTLVSQITALAGSLFTDGEPVVLGYLMQIVDRWAEIVGKEADGRALVSCPINFTEEERTQQREDQAKWEAGVELMDEILRKLGAYSGWDGFVSHADYDSMKRLVIEARETFLREVATNEAERETWSRVWPFPASA